MLTITKHDPTRLIFIPTPPNPFQCWTSYTPSLKELSRRSYDGIHVPSYLCPRCGIVLTVNEKKYTTTNADAPHYERRLTCPNFFVNGCQYTEPFTDAILVELNAPKIEVAQDW